MASSPATPTRIQPVLEKVVLDQLTAALWRHPISGKDLYKIGQSIPNDLDLYQMLTGRNKDELFINARPYDLVPEAERPSGVIFLWSVIYGVRATYKSLRDKFQQYGREDLVFLLSKMVTVEAEISAQSGECNHVHVLGFAITTALSPITK